MPRIIAIAAGLLIVYQWAVARPLWLDEQMVAINIRDRGFVALAGKLSLEQSAPYGWLVLERLVLLIFGSGERSLRLIPMLCGLAIIATALWIGRRWLSPLATSLLVAMCGVGQWLTYSFAELKQYSADAWFGLLLPALAVWAIETDRVLAWWIVAAIAQWFGNGALFVTPLCAVAITLIALQRRGVAAALRAAAPGVLWLALFAVNYVVVLRPAQTSEFLQGYWQLMFPPTSAGVAATVQWLALRLAPFAVKPGGTQLGLWLWIISVAGFALASGRARLLALMFATVPVSGFLLTTLHFLPFFERLVLWMVPATYVGVALLSDVYRHHFVSTSDAHRNHFVSTSEVNATLIRRTGGVLLTATAVVGALRITADIVSVGYDDMKLRSTTTNHLLDDRSTIRWLAAREQPGDVWLTTHLALPAIWWYAPKTTAPIVEIGYADPGPKCHPDDLGHALNSASRALVFTGFHFDDVPKSFDALLMDRLMSAGQMTAYRGFESISRAAIFDRRLASRRERGEQVPGCLTTRPALRW